MSKGLETGIINPVFIDHGKDFNTCIPVTPFDPRLGGYDIGDPRPYVYPKEIPDFQGQIVAYYIKQGSYRYAHMLIGHDAGDGQGLRWIEIDAGQQGILRYNDPRTTQAVDPFFEFNCDPPWICE
jgi:hypothetical protein